MGLQRYVFPFFLIIMSFFVSCYSNSIHEEVSVVLDHNHLVDEEEAFGYDSQAYPSYVSILEDNKFGDLINQTTDDNLPPSLKSFSKLLENKAAATWLNVNDFGAKGDGTDDTEVHIKYIQIK